MATAKRNVTTGVAGHTFELDAEWVRCHARFNGPSTGESSDRLLAFLGLLFEVLVSIPPCAGGGLRRRGRRVSSCTSGSRLQRLTLKSRST